MMSDNDIRDDLPGPLPAAAADPVMQWHHEVPWARSKLARALRVSPNTLCGLSTCAMDEMSAADDGLPWCPGCRDVESGWSYLRWALVRLARPAATHRAQAAAWESEQVRAEYAELVAWARAAVVSPWLTRRGDAAALRILGASAALEEITRARGDVAVSEPGAGAR